MRDVNQREPMFTRTINSQFKLHRCPTCRQLHANSTL